MPFKPFTKKKNSDADAKKKPAKKGKPTTSAKPAWQGVADKMLGENC